MMEQLSRQSQRQSERAGNRVFLSLCERLVYALATSAFVLSLAANA